MRDLMVGDWDSWAVTHLDEIIAGLEETIEKLGRPDPLHETERRILNLLVGKAMTGKMLATELYINEQQLNRDFVGPESRLRTSRHIDQRPGIGYFRPDKPPAE